MATTPCNAPTIETSPMMKAIHLALQDAPEATKGIRVSITPTGEWYLPKGEQEAAFVKWLCWNLTLNNGEDATEPEYCVVHGELDQHELGNALRANFPGRTIVVDNDIEME